MGSHVIDRFLNAVETADIPSADVFSDSAVLDATVPNWRFGARGRDGVVGEFSKWYADPGKFEMVNRVDIPGGEIVEFLLTWKERGIPHACHQLHWLTVKDGRIVSDKVWCGGRWPASLLAEMAAEAGEPAEQQSG